MLFYHELEILWTNHEEENKIWTPESKRGLAGKYRISVGIKHKAESSVYQVGS